MDILKYKFEENRLMVIIPDRLSDLTKKGEVIQRYYNPGELFKEVHILMINDDRPDTSYIQKTVGDANLFLYNMPITKKHFFRSLGYRPRLLESWARPAIELAKKIKPSLIRCHANGFNTYIASMIKKNLSIPYIVSLHINPDEDVKKRDVNWKGKLRNMMIKSIEYAGLRNSDYVLPVYKSIIPYIEKMGVKKYEVAYNVLNPNFLKKKEDYKLHNPIRILSVGRLFKEKNPENIIKALKNLPKAHLTIIGDGPYYDYLKNTVNQNNLEKQVAFKRSVPNDRLSQQLAEYDIFAIHSEYWEINKSVLEAFLVGLPVVINRRIGEPVPEFDGDFLILVENSVEEYYRAFKRLIEDDKLREGLGQKAYIHAQKNWAPEKTEMKYVEIYRRTINEAKIKS
jgi:glycosyltransferase involved in cell wall biosynthesis